MKKALSILLSLAMVMSLSVSVFAADNKELDLVSDNTATFDIGGTLTAVKAENETAYVYSVTISWEYDTDYEALFSKQVMYEWDPTTLMYSLSEDSNEDYVSDNADPINVKITTTNYSNGELGVKIAYEDASDGFDTEVSGDGISNNSYYATLGSADNKVGTISPEDKLVLSNPNAIESAGEVTTDTYEAEITISIDENNLADALANSGEHAIGTYTITLSEFHGC